MLRLCEQQISLAWAALDRIDSECSILGRVALAVSRGASWEDCAELYGLPRTRKGAEAARQRFFRACGP